MSIYIILVILHIIGTVLGVGGGTFAELNYIKALRDGVVTPEESQLMQMTYTVLRLGLFLLVLSGFGFLLYYRLNGFEEALYSPALWAKLTIIGILTANASLLQLHKIPLAWGSAISFTSWYAALILGVLLTDSKYSYFGVMAVYVVSIIIVFFILRAVHKKLIPSHT